MWNNANMGQQALGGQGQSGAGAKDATIYALAHLMLLPWLAVLAFHKHHLHLPLVSLVPLKRVIQHHPAWEQPTRGVHWIGRAIAAGDRLTRRSLHCKLQKLQCAASAMSHPLPADWSEYMHQGHPPC